MTVVAFDMATGTRVGEATLSAPFFGDPLIAPTAHESTVFVLADKLPPPARSFAELDAPAPWYLIGLDVRSGRTRHAVELTSSTQLSSRGFLNVSPSGKWAALIGYPQEMRGDTTVSRSMPYLAVVNVEQDTVQHEVFMEQRGMFAQPVFASDDSALYVYEYGQRRVYRLALPSMTLDSVYAVPALPRFGQFAGLIPSHDGEMLLHYRSSLQTTVFVTLDEKGTPHGGATLDVNSPDYAFVDDRTLVGISSVAPPDTTLPIRPPRRTVSSKMEPMKLVYIDTDTWTIEREVTVELPEGAINGLQLIAKR